MKRKKIKYRLGNQKIKFFLDKKQTEEEQKNRTERLIQTFLINREQILLKRLSVPILGALAGILGLVMLVTLPVIVVLAIFYHSPFALFLPPLQDGETVQELTGAYVSEFVSEAESLAEDHVGYDEGELSYEDTDGKPIDTSTMKDIMCVYMVRYGVGDNAAVMHEKSKDRLQDVVADMCVCSTDSRNEKRRSEAGKIYEVFILEVRVIFKDYEDMIKEYGFSHEQAEILEQMMMQW